jgi:hypothetical protein
MPSLVMGATLLQPAAGGYTLLASGQASTATPASLWELSLFSDKAITFVPQPTAAAGGSPNPNVCQLFKGDYTPNRQLCLFRENLFVPGEAPAAGGGKGDKVAVAGAAVPAVPTNQFVSAEVSMTDPTVSVELSVLDGESLEPLATARGVGSARLYWVPLMFPRTPPPPTLEPKKKETEKPKKGDGYAGVHVRA